MKESVVKKCIIAIIVIALLVPVVLEMFANKKIATIPYSDLSTIVKESDNDYGFALVYVSPESDENVEENKQAVIDTVESYMSPATGDPLTAKFVDYDALSDTEKKEIFGNSSEKIAYITIANGSKIRTVVGSVSTNQLKAFISADSGNGISEDLVSYKVAANAAAYQKLVKDKKKVTMAVFGRDTCFYCNQFKIIYNKVARNNGLDIYYFDSDSYDEAEMKKIADMDLVVPGKCLKSGVDTKMSEAKYGTPLTLFTKNGKVVDCINGYVNEEKLVTQLKEVGMMKE